MQIRNYPLADALVGNEVVIADQEKTVGITTQAIAKFANDYAAAQRAPNAVVNVKDPAFGAAGDGVHDDTSALMAAIVFALFWKIPLYLPTGVYRITRQIIVDLASVYATGFKIYGDGTEMSVLDFGSLATSPNFLLTCTRTPGDCFFPQILDIGMKGNLAGTVLQIGKDDYSDPINRPLLRVAAKNSNTGAASRAVRINHVVNGDIVIGATCGATGVVGGNGIALTVRQLIMSRVTGACSSAEYGIVFDDGNTFGNNFAAMNVGNVKTCVSQQSQHSGNNTFANGNFSYSRFGVDSTGPGRLVFDNVSPNPQGSATILAFANPLARSGVILRELEQRTVFLADNGGVSDYNQVTGAGTDNTPAFLRCFAALGSRGGRVIVPDGFLGLIATSFRVPNSIRIVTESRMIGIDFTPDMPLYGAGLYVDPAVSITLASSVWLSVNIFRRGLTYNITSAQVSATFKGTAFVLENSSADATFENMMILGFGVGVTTQSTTGNSGPYVSRTRFLGVVGMDNQIDVHIHNASDIPYLHGLHCWPYVTVYSPPEANGEQLKRTGPSIWLSGLNDWTKLMVPFNYGKKIGFRFTDCQSVKIYSAGADYPYQTSPDGSIGFLFDGTTLENTLFGGQCAQHDSGVYVSSTGGAHALTAVGCDMWENRVNGFAVLNGHVQIIGGRIRSSYPGSNGIQTGPNAGKVRVVAVEFRNLPGTALINDNPTVDLQHSMCTFVNCVNIAKNPFVYQVAAVDPLPLDGEHTTIVLTAGVSRIGTVLNVSAYESRTLTFQATQAITFVAGGSFSMAANQVLAAGDVLTFSALNGVLKLIAKS